MSYSNEVKLELTEAPIKKNCCKKAFLIGLLINVKRTGANSFEAEFFGDIISQKTEILLKTLYNCNSKKSTVQKPGKLYHKLEFSSASISALMDTLDAEPDVSISEAISFRCPSCEQMFLRGAFISCAKLNDPQKSYNLEFTLSKENLARASKLYRFLSISGFIARITNRSSSSGLYFKSNQTISDLLYFMGAVRASFDHANSGIEKEIRNNENRATNCVARNIQKSVNTSQKHIQAINKLISSHKIDALPEELQITAKIRIENQEATLFELASLHNPPISKSGLNHRLAKLCREAEVLDD